jgi:CubicO group peptidase (beta-lactamase class C family)
LLHSRAVQRTDPRKIIAIVLLALGAALAVLYGTDPKTRSVLNWTYFARFFSYPRSKPVTSVDWYQPVEKVVGGDGPMLRRIRKTDPLGASVRAKLDEFAKASSSEALLVIRAAGRRAQDDPELLYEYIDPAAPLGDRPGRHLLTDGNSMAKTAVGLLVGVAIAQGKIDSLDEKASRFLPEWRNDGRRDITIRHLLAMQSGLRNQNSKTFPLSDLAVMHLGTKLEPFVLSIPAAEPPGKRYEYNNVNSQVLGVILERVYGQRYSTLLSEHLWKPIAAQDSFLWLDHESGLARTYCCLMATAYDWGRIGLLLLSGGRAGKKQIVPRGWVSEMLKPSSAAKEFGLHLFLGTPAKGYEARGLYFLSGLAEQHVWVIPEEKVVIVRVGEKAKPWSWEESYVPNLVWRALPHS